MMICELVKCDVEFEPRTYHHKFCTSQHAKAAKDRRYYERNREAVIAQTKSYHEANPEIARRSMRNYLASDMGYANTELSLVANQPNDVMWYWTPSLLIL